MQEKSARVARIYLQNFQLWVAGGLALSQYVAAICKRLSWLLLRQRKNVPQCSKCATGRAARTPGLA